MAKLLSRIIVRKIDHSWLRSPFFRKEELSRPVVKGRVGEPFISFLPYILAPPTSSFPMPHPPIAPTPVPANLDPEEDLMIFG